MQKQWRWTRWSLVVGGCMLLSACDRIEENQDPASPEAVFRKNCASCHGTRALGGGMGPSLKKVCQKPAEDFNRVVIEGRRNMPSFARSPLTKDPEALNALRSWVCGQLQE